MILLQRAEILTLLLSEFKCKGCPWFETAVVNLVPRVLLFDLLSVLESHGFRLYASLDQRIGVSSPMAVEYHED